MLYLAMLQSKFQFNKRSRSNSAITASLICTLVLIWIWCFHDVVQTSLSQHPFLKTSPTTTKPTTNIYEKVAVIIEDRPLTNIIPLILHFSKVLGPDWPILYFTNSHARTDNPLLNSSAPFRRALETGAVEIRDLPSTTDFSTHASVSSFFTLPWIWEALAPAEHVLLFQADSIICANSEHSIEDFLKYDMIGAPIAYHLGAGYNGGLSLRNRSMVLDIISSSSFDEEKSSRLIKAGGCLDGEPCLTFEDQWLYAKMLERGARLPDRETASMFAVETVWSERPLGYHQVERWNKNRIGEVEKWCPEYRMATTDLLVMHGKEKQTKGNSK